MKFFVALTLITLGLSLATASQAQAYYTYAVSQNGVATSGDPSNPDSTGHELSDGALGSATSIDSPYVIYHMNYSVVIAITGQAATMFNKVRLYAFRQSSTGVGIPTHVQAVCINGGTNRSANATFTPTAYPDNSRSYIEIATPGWGGCFAIGLTVDNTASSYIALSEMQLLP